MNVGKDKRGRYLFCRACKGIQQLAPHHLTCPVVMALRVEAFANRHRHCCRNARPLQAQTKTWHQPLPEDRKQAVWAGIKKLMADEAIKPLSAEERTFFKPLEDQLAEQNQPPPVRVIPIYVVPRPSTPRRTPPGA